MFSNKEIVELILHDRVEDHMPWDYCAGLIKINLSIEISPKELEKLFNNYFKELTGIRPNAKCPLCQNKLTPRKSKYGYFIGCSAFPKCEFIATSNKPYLPKRSNNK